jgi:hypothetical protein
VRVVDEEGGGPVELSGKCLCGAVEFTAEVRKQTHSVCHCTMCRRWSAGPFLGVRVDRVTFGGEANIGRYASSSWAERGFCKICGSTLFYHLLPTGMMAMSAGAFDESASFGIDSEIFVDHKPEGFTLAGEHPRLTEAETLARFAPKS